MSLCVEEVKENGEYNLANAVMPFQTEIGKEQLENYRIAKELGADDDDDWSEWEDRVEEYKAKN